MLPSLEGTFPLFSISGCYPSSRRIFQQSRFPPFYMLLSEWFLNTKLITVPSLLKAPVRFLAVFRINSKFSGMHSRYFWGVASHELSDLPGPINLPTILTLLASRPLHILLSHMEHFFLPPFYPACFVGNSFWVKRAFLYGSFSLAMEDYVGSSPTQCVSTTWCAYSTQNTHFTRLKLYFHLSPIL